MVSTRRQVIYEKDRYGGFAEAETVNAELRTEEPIKETRIEPARRSFYTDAAISPATDKPSYTGRNANAYPKTAEFIGTYTVPTPVRRKTPRDSSDVMPEIKRYRVEEKESARQEQPKAKEREKITPKSKAFIAVYMAVVVVLAAIVIATGLAISGASSSVASLESDLAAKNSVITTQGNQLDMLGNETMIKGQATENGMVAIKDLKTVSVIPVVQSAEYPPRTNWFDKFCDWLEKIIGG